MINFFELPVNDSPADFGEYSAFRLLPEVRLSFAPFFPTLPPSLEDYPTPLPYLMIDICMSNQITSLLEPPRSLA
jgi:hypothetical protein